MSGTRILVPGRLSPIPRLTMQHICDALHQVFPLAQALVVGATGLNRAFGKPTTLPWRLVIEWEFSCSISRRTLFTPRLYESLWNLVGAFLQFS